MNDDMVLDCGEVRELIPDLVAGALPLPTMERVEAHARMCAECRAELELARLIFSSRPAVPAGLLDRIERSTRDARTTPRRTWWGVSAAAIAAVAVGIGITARSGTEGAGAIPAYAYEAEEGQIWSSEDGLMAGAPALGDLSDEALLELLDELTSGAGGGSV